MTPKIAHSYALVPILQKKSLLLTSPPASGRGSATMIGILNLMDYSLKRTQAIVLSPRKELAEEYLFSLRELAKNTPVTMTLCTGKANLDLKLLSSINIIVATPGKLGFCLRNNHLDPNYLKVFVCDVASKLFKDPMISDTVQILDLIRNDCIFWYLSPTNSQRVEGDFTARARNTEIIKILKDERVLEEITFYAKVTESEQEKREFIEGRAYHSNRQMIIFGGESDGLEQYEELLKDMSAVLLSGDFSKLHQKSILDDFKNEVIKVLICESKSSLCRKIQAKSSVDVINLNIPKNIEMFLMRLRRFNYDPEDTVIIVESPERYVGLQELAGDLQLKIVLY